MKRILGIIVIVLLVLLGGYIYIKILLDAGSEIKGELPTTPYMATPETAAMEMVVEKETEKPEMVTTTTLAMIEEPETMVVPAAQGLVVSGALGTGVEDHVLVGEATEFGADVGRVYCLTTVTGADEPTQISHVWYYKDQEKARTELPIKYKKHRTWSYKTIHPEWVGNWRVDVVDAGGKVLKSFPFMVR